MRIIILISIFIISAGCLTSAQNSGFGSRIDMGEIENDNITEASGIAASKKNFNVLWVHNDSKGENRIFAINNRGKNLGEYFLTGVNNRDWEDIAAGPGPVQTEDYIYIGEFGDNKAVYDISYIYRFIEPDVDTSQTGVTDVINEVDIIRFLYPDGRRDSETLMLDNETKDLYIVTKREDSVQVYRLTYPQSTTKVHTLEKITNLDFSNATGGDISPDNNEILIRTYKKIYYWKRAEEISYREIFSSSPAILPYIEEPQGEGICWSYNADGYYTISEEIDSPAHLYYYPRLTTSIDNKKDETLQFKLFQNYPNPFNPVTTINWYLPESSEVSVNVYNSLGKKIKTLVNEHQQKGYHKIKFDPGNVLASGIYYYKIIAGKFSETKKLLLLK